MVALALGALTVGCASSDSAPADAEFRTEFDGTPSLAASYQPQFLPLASRGRAEPEQSKLDGVFPVIDERWVVLGAAEDSWGAGETRLLQTPAQASQGAVLSLTRALSAAAANPALARVRGASVELGGPDTPDGCAATLGSPQVLRRVEPEAAGLDSDEAPKVGSPAYVKRAWERAQGFGLVVAKLQVSDASCAKASYARFSTASDVDVVERAQPSPDDKHTFRLAQQIYVGLRELPSYKRLQKDYQDYLTSAGSDGTALADESAWETHAAAQPELVVYGDGARRFIGWSLNAGEGCGDFYGNLSVLYEVVETSDGEQLNLVEINEASGLPERVVVSASGVQLIDSSGVRQAGAEQPAIPLHVVAFGCSC